MASRRRLVSRLDKMRRHAWRAESVSTERSCGGIDHKKARQTQEHSDARGRALQNMSGVSILPPRRERLTGRSTVRA